MDFGWIMSPVAQYGALALGLVACLALFMSTKFEMHSTWRLAVTSRESAAANLERLSSELRKLQEGLESLTPAPAPPPSLNLNKRLRALRMHRRGEPVATIAAALQVSQNEIELLLKVHKIAQADSITPA